MKTAEFFAAHAADADIDAPRRLLRRDGGQPPEPHDRLEDDSDVRPGTEGAPAPYNAHPSRRRTVEFGADQRKIPRPSP